MNISSADDERAFNEYKEAREIPRVFVARIHRNGKALLAAYAAFEARLADEDDLGDFAAYHASITGGVNPHVQSIIDNIQSAIATIEAIEKAVPGTFSIELPAEPEPEAEPEA